MALAAGKGQAAPGLETLVAAREVSFLVSPVAAPGLDEAFAVAAEVLVLALGVEAEETQLVMGLWEVAGRVATVLSAVAASDEVVEAVEGPAAQTEAAQRAASAARAMARMGVDTSVMEAGGAVG